MRIQRVAFGSLVLDGRTYTSDLIIYPDGRVRDGWRRARGHRLSVEDIAGLVETAPDLIVAGTGVNGRVRPDPDLEERLTREGIRLHAWPNEKAATVFNERAGAERVGACFHLTC
jgi:hypothetical protein